MSGDALARIASVSEVFQTIGLRDEIFDSTMNRIGQSVLEVSEEHFDIFITLLKEYKVHTNIEKDLMILKTIIDQVPCVGNKYIAPAVKSRFSSIVKSGHKVRDIVKKLDVELKYKYDPYCTNIKRGDILIIIDDFIGTGETIEDCVRFYTKSGWDVIDIRVYTIAAMDFGIKYLINTLGLDAKAMFIHKKCFQIGYIFDSVNEKLKVYEDMERTLNFNHEFRGGHAGSEALLTVTRTPDNTLPVFWIDTPWSGGKWYAPFPR